MVEIDGPKHLGGDDGVEGRDKHEDDEGVEHRYDARAQRVDEDAQRLRLFDQPFSS